MYESNETEPMPLDHEADLSGRSIRFETLLRARSWSARQLRYEIKRAHDDGLVEYGPESRHARLTPDGYALATRVVRNHRLWEMYLITHADIAASHVDRDADAIEHVLGSDMVRTLETVLADNQRQLAATPAAGESAHALNSPRPTRGATGDEIMIDRVADSLRHFEWSLDGWIIVAGVLCAVASALLGPFLVLRRMSMMGDAISHAVLPLAVAFILTDSRASLPMFVGAAVVGVLTAVFTEWVRGFGKVDEGASMGVVFTVLFAIGLVMVVQAADSVDLDPGCVLYGAIEMTRSTR